MTAGPAPGVHALEAAVDRLLAHAHALSPGVYTHAHRYVPSDSCAVPYMSCSLPSEFGCSFKPFLEFGLKDTPRYKILAEY